MTSGELEHQLLEIKSGKLAKIFIKVQSKFQVDTKKLQIICGRPVVSLNIWHFNNVIYSSFWHQVPKVQIIVLSWQFPLSCSQVGQKGGLSGHMGQNHRPNII
jgi:hypothetical protein